MSRRNEIWILGVLVVILAVVVYWNYRPKTMAGSGALESVSVLPLRVPDPSLHLDRLARLRRMKYTGAHRNIFSSKALPPPPPSKAAVQKAAAVHSVVARPVPRPLQVPLTFYGMAIDPKTGTKLAFFTSGDHVYIAHQGETLLGRFRLLQIGTNTVEFQEISSGKTAVLTMTPPVAR